ncbi:MAG: GNAT family N-acetyltransferase [Hyphomonadaceae bacterium]|jgi:acetyltransferase|nr:GNAT family N-acetyltransferase [Hyphomonadaceae bacterium]
MNHFEFDYDADLYCRMFCRPIRTGFGEVTVRPIRPADAGLVQAFVGDLSATSRYLRFFQPLRHLPPALLDRFVGVDQVTQMALVGIALVEGVPRIVGEARCALSAGGESADIAIVVADSWQRRGIGTGLLSTLERIAASTGVTQLTGKSFATNETFRRFAGAFGFDARPDAADRTFLRIEKHIGSSASISPRC